MKTWLQFTECSRGPKTSKFAVSCRSLRLGEIKWYAPWRRYAFFPIGETLYDASCLRDIMQFINDLMASREIAKRRESEKEENK